MKKALTVNAYIASAPKEIQEKLQQLRKAILSVAPKAEEKISYGMPYYGYKGRLAYFAFFKDHISLFAMPPIPEKYKAVLKNHITGKSTIQFSFNEKLPIALIKKLVKERAERNEEKQKA